MDDRTRKMYAPRSDHNSTSRNSNPNSTIQYQQQPTNTNSTDTNPNTHPKKTHVNDGTLRVTVRWKPEMYTDIKEDEDAWNLAATDTVHYILATAGEATLFPWMNGSTTPNIPSLELTPDNLLQYLAPKVTPINSLQMYVFSFRLCLGTGPGKWINSNITKKSFIQHRVEVSLSNSFSDSGDTISVAG